MEGKKFDNEKVDMDLLSPHALEKIAQVMTYGKKKYGANNWRGGITYSRLLAAVMRHVNSYRKGEFLDPETGLSHLSHASCGLMMLLEFEETRPDLNDLFFKEQKNSGADLYKAGEQAQEKVKQMIEDNKREIFNFKKRPTKFVKGDVVKHMNNDVEVTVEGIYYDENDNAVLFVRDADQKVFGVDPNFYKSIYTEKAK